MQQKCKQYPGAFQCSISRHLYRRPHPSTVELLMFAHQELFYSELSSFCSSYNVTQEDLPLAMYRTIPHFVVLSQRKSFPTACDYMFTPTFSASDSFMNSSNSSSLLVHFLEHQGKRSWLFFSPAGSWSLSESLSRWAFSTLKGMVTTRKHLIPVEMEKALRTVFWNIHPPIKNDRRLPLFIT